MRVRPVDGVARQRDDASLVAGKDRNGSDQGRVAHVHLGASIVAGDVRRLLCPSGSISKVRLRYIVL